MAMAADAGFTVCDLIVKVRKGPMVSTKWKTAHHARKRHCFWIICRNGTSCERKAMRYHNPLTLEELGRNAASAIRNWPAVSMPPERFDGAGVYAIYYRGYPALYPNIKIRGNDPIHVGKAVSSSGNRYPLNRRLKEHAGSIEDASNLNLPDFWCRWIVPDDVWIGMTEQVLIDTHEPIWNLSIVREFGNHNQGKSRIGQERSRWDTLHPGRAWAALQRDNRASAERIREEIAEYHREGDGKHG